MEYKVFTLKCPVTSQPLMVVTDNQEIALATFSKYLNKRRIDLLCWLQGGRLVTVGNTTKTYYQDFMCIIKQDPKTFTELIPIEACECCGKF